MSEMYLYADPSLTHSCHISCPELKGFAERHRIHIPVQDLQQTPDLFGKLTRSEVSGIVIGMCRGWPGLGCIRFAGRALKAGRKVWFYWPEEEAVECVDTERLRSYWTHWGVASVYEYILGPLRRALKKPAAAAEAPPPASPVTAEPTTAPVLSSLVQDYLAKVTEIGRNPRPIPLSVETSDEGFHIRGKGIYLRTDFWAPISSGGSYGHTCYIANELSQAADGLVCFLPHRYTLLDELGLHQVVLPPFQYRDESSLLQAPSHYGTVLKTALEAVRPAFIYERICLGNYCGAQLSRELGIPYIVEYNGSEITMKRSFDGAPYEYEACYLAAEKAAFEQATVISVVSEPIKEDLVKRGVPAAKVLVNPNGADLEAYSPASSDVKHSLRKAFGWNGTDRVVGFTGTFGGWHGIDVLAQAIPKICSRVPEAKFLLIGDGQYKKLVDDELAKHKLNGRVHSTGRVPQQQGALLLRLCDIYVSPHSRHMVGSRFFGSPTKIFEYMAMGGAIVASDLEQIGQVLSPALRSSELGLNGTNGSSKRAILCKPGSVEEFVDAVEFLLRHPDVCDDLGRNARQAVVENYSWNCHVQRLCGTLAHGSEAAELSASDESTETTKDVSQPQAPASESQPPGESLVAEDAYKLEVQKQWDNDPCGSHYVKEAEPHTLDWFLEAESYRYGDYAPWMPDVMEFDRHRGERVLEIGGGMGTDLSQFARHGAVVTDIDLSAGHLRLAQENFRLRGLQGEFVHHDAENLPFEDNSFDVVYSNGVIHHTPNTAEVVQEMFRVLRPGGCAIVMVYAENSWHYWYQLVYVLGLAADELKSWSMSEIMSRHAELGESGARPLVKVYTARGLSNLFRKFSEIEIVKRQLTAPELPLILRKVMAVETAGKVMGWNLILKARKPL